MRGRLGASARIPYFFLIILVPVLCLTGSREVLTASDNGEGAGTYYYYSGGKRVELEPSSEFIAVRPYGKGGERELAKAHPELAEADSQDGALPGGFTLMRLKQGMSSSDARRLSGELSQDPSIQTVAPVFSAQGADMAVTDELIAQFAPSMNEESIKAINSQYGVEIVERFEWASNTYLLRTISGANALDTANAYHEREEVVYAQPNFVRIRKSMPRLPQEKGDKGSRIILGPDGSRIASDASIPKGVSDYRIVEPSSMLLSAESAALAASVQPAQANETTIRFDNFESGSIPTDWSLSGSPTWAAVAHRAYSGAWSAYSVGSSVSPPGPYPNNANSRMVYGPFSLSDALDARLDFQAWINTESGYDRFQVLASTDNVNFYGNALSGNYTVNTDANGWVNVAFDLKDTPTLGDLRGQGSVWISLAFTSDQSITAEGVYVDDLALEKITGSYVDLTSDPYSSMQWSLLNYGQTWGSAGMDIQAREAWSISQGSADIVIAVVDNGVDLTHPDLVNKLVAGYDATGRGSNGGPSGDDAHGTCVAGIAAAETDNGIGIAGIGRSVKIMPVRIFYSDTIFGYDISTDSWIANGIVWAVDSGADILNNSWAGGNTSDLVSSAISYAKTYGREGKGSVVVFAAGNENGALIFPATLSEVLAVGALSPCGERKSPSSCDGEYWWGSNYGENMAVLAPGVSMYTTDRQGSLGYGSGDYISNFNGTSAATPVVSGIAALMLSVNPNLTASQIEYAIKASADDLGSPGWDQSTGYGKVNAYYALLSLYEPVPAEWQGWFAVDAKETPMVGDFNGDGMTDIITFTRDNPNAVGDVYVALSEGNRFGNNSFWSDWFAVSPDETVVIGDFNGDGMDDIATWLGKSSRQVYVAVSYGYGMDSSAVWMNSIGNNSDDVLKAGDVDGDGLDDLVLFARQQGLVYVARSNGGGFDAPQVWHNWFAVSAYERPEMGDVDGDGRADIITFATDSPTAQGDVFVALSTGQMFEDGLYSAKWHDWFGVAPTEKISIGDIDGDGRDDFFTSLPPPAGQTYVAYSQGTFMTDSVLWEQFFTRYDSDVPFAGDANGDGKADIILFRRSEGKVYVALTP